MLSVHCTCSNQIQMMQVVVVVGVPLKSQYPVHLARTTPSMLQFLKLHSPVMIRYNTREIQKVIVRLL